MLIRDCARSRIVKRSQTEERNENHLHDLLNRNWLCMRKVRVCARALAWSLHDACALLRWCLTWNIEFTNQMFAVSLAKLMKMKRKKIWVSQFWSKSNFAIKSRQVHIQPTCASARARTQEVRVKHGFLISFSADLFTFFFIDLADNDFYMILIFIFSSSSSHFVSRQFAN